jgi:ribose transport system permease protein
MPNEIQSHKKPPTASATSLSGIRVALTGRFGTFASSYTLTIAFALLAILIAIANPRFLLISNLVNIVNGTAVIGIMACGMTVTMIGGGFDLSVARLAAFSGIVLFLAQDLGPVAAVAITLVAASCVGLVNGLLIVRGHVNPFVVTLGMQAVIGSLALLTSGGNFLTYTADWVPSLGAGYLGPLPTPIFVWAGVAIACHLLLSRTRAGRYVYAAGGNVEAARLAGVPTGRIIISTYVLVALSAGIAGLVLVGRLASASAIALPGAELDVIAAVIIGGTKLGGGSGAIINTVVGTLILATLSNGVILMSIDPNWQGVIKGAVIIAAVAFDVFQSARRSR